MAWGDIANIFNSNNVLFDLIDTAPTPVLQEIIFVHRFRIIKDLPVNRTNSRAGPVETPSFVLREFNINADITKDLFDRLEAISEPTARGGFNTVGFQMRAQNIGVVGNDVTLNFDGFVRHFEGNALTDEKFNTDFITRAVNSSVVIT